MASEPRPGTVFWIDHYVVASHDLDRWADFMTSVIGSHSHESFAPGGRRFLQFQQITPCCHHGAMISPEPLQPTTGLGTGLPRHGLYIRQSDIDHHVRRLDELKVPHLDPVRTSAEGEGGIAIAWQDPDGNQFEFWAPDRLPEGAMDGATALGVGRISHGVYESRDLERAADHFDRFCAIEPQRAGETDGDTLVLPLMNGARVVYKKTDEIHHRTGGWGKLSAAHAALVVRDQDFWSNYDRMWAEVPEWGWDRETDCFLGAGPELPARTARHGSPAGRRWYEVRQRGDDWYDHDTNCFHFVGGVPRKADFSRYEPHSMEWQLPRFLEAQGLTA
jgi:hypothetical protein